VGTWHGVRRCQTLQFRNGCNLQARIQMARIGYCLDARYQNPRLYSRVTTPSVVTSQIAIMGRASKNNFPIYT